MAASVPLFLALRDLGTAPRCELSLAFDEAQRAHVCFAYASWLKQRAARGGMGDSFLL